MNVFRIYYTVTLRNAALRWFPSTRVRLSSPSTPEHLAVAQLSLIQFWQRPANLSKTENQRYKSYMYTKYNNAKHDLYKSCLKQSEGWFRVVICDFHSLLGFLQTVRIEMKTARKQFVVSHHKSNTLQVGVRKNSYKISKQLQHLWKIELSLTSARIMSSFSY